MEERTELLLVVVEEKIVVLLEDGVVTAAHLVGSTEGETEV